VRESASTLFTTSASGAFPAAGPGAGPLEVPVWDADTDALDAFLRSDRAPPDSMLLSELDGFLAGIAIGPQIILPSEWLPLVWGEDEPVFDDGQEAQAVIGGMMSRFNQIIQEIGNGTFAPIVWETPDGTVIATDWAEGFRLAVSLRKEAWEPLFTAEGHRDFFWPILALGLDSEDLSALGLDSEAEEELLRAAPDILPTCVMSIAGFWRGRRPRGKGIRVDRGPSGVRIAAGRNDPCPCGSGIKFKKCCGP